MDSKELTGKMEVILEIIAKGKENITKFSTYKEGMYSGPIVAQLARKSLAYIQDAEAKIKALMGPSLTVVANNVAAPSPAPAKPVVKAPDSTPDVAFHAATFDPQKVKTVSQPAPEFKINVAWKAITAPCPVCKEEATLGLTAKAQLGDGKAHIELLVCSVCIVKGTPVDDDLEKLETEVLPPDNTLTFPPTPQ